MQLYNLLTILTMAVIAAAAPQPDPPNKLPPTMPLPDNETCPKEPHCVLITYDTTKQIELDNTSCTNLQDGTVYGVLVASCTCWVFSNYDCTDNFDKFEQCPGLMGPDFKDGKLVRSIRCEGQ